MSSLPAIPSLSQNQFLRKCTLLVTTTLGEALDLSSLRIKFAVKRSDTMTPNCGDFRIYNLDLATAALIKKEFTKVIFQAGYLPNYGVIFKGNIKQVILGRESATDTYIDIVAGDGDRAYNFAIVNTTLAKGSTQLNQLAAIQAPMGSKGVTPGYTGVMIPKVLPRGKVMYGNAKDHLRNLCDSNGFGASIQDEKLNIIKKTTYLPGLPIVLTSKTGLVGTPQQTNEGVNCKSLLNPNIKIGGQIFLNNKSIELLKINLSVPGSPSNIPAPLTADGIYYVLVAEHKGDTRGLEWYTDIVSLNIDVTTNPLNSIKVGG